MLIEVSHKGTNNPVKVVGLLPMRAHSERVPNKNIRDFHGRPLYHHILESLLACRYIDEVCIDTDSEFIMKDAPEHFERVRIVERPEHLRSGHTPMNEVLLHDVTQIDAGCYLQTHSTNPLLTPDTITRAIETFLDSPEFDSLFSVTRWQCRLWDAQMRALNHDPDVLLRTQDLTPVYEENSNLYLFSKSVLVERRNRIGARPLLFEINRLEVEHYTILLACYKIQFCFILNF